MNQDFLAGINKLNKIRKYAGNPKAMVMEMAKNNSNPVVQQLIQYAEEGKNDKIEEFARNVCKEKGIDFDKEFNSMMNFFQ